MFRLFKGDVAIPITGVRKAIADKMVKSKNEIPHAWMMVEVDVTDPVGYRNEIKDQFKRRKVYHLTFFAFFVKAVAQALKEFPQLNSFGQGIKLFVRMILIYPLLLQQEMNYLLLLLNMQMKKQLRGTSDVKPGDPRDQIRHPRACPDARSADARTTRAHPSVRADRGLRARARNHQEGDEPATSTSCCRVRLWSRCGSTKSTG